MFTRSIAVVLAALFGCCPAFAQKGSNHANGNNLYAVALFASVREMDKSWGNIDDSDITKGLRTDYKHVFVESSLSTTDSLPSQDGEYRVEYLNKLGEIDRCKKLKKPFAILTIEPMQSDGTFELETLGFCFSDDLLQLADQVHIRIAVCIREN